MAITDRYDLPLTTSSTVAAEHFQHGMDALLAYGPGAEQSFAAAVAADPGLALAHGGLALVAVVQGDARTARAATARAPPTAPGGAPPRPPHPPAPGPP